MKNNYSIFVDGFDWGPCVTEAILNVDGILDINKLKVFEKRQVTDFTKENFPIVVKEFERKVTDIKYDDNACVQISLKESPEEGNPFVFSMNTQYNRWSKPYELRFEYDGKNIETNKEPIEIICKTDSQFEERIFLSKDGIELKYAIHKPKNNSHNLIIWLHGMGEGGFDTRYPILGNKVSALADDYFQDELDEFWILVPQCPTFWMDETGHDKTVNNNGTSFYTKALIDLIKAFEGEIKSNKVVLTGCSNGGFMTMRLAIDAPELFDGFVPICEALADKFISDDEIQKLKDLPMYFVYAENDEVVPPKDYEIPTIERLLNANAKKIHVFHPKDVVDQTGKYKDKTGNPYSYIGHWSWIYFFNDECDADGVKITDFIKKIFNEN